MVSGIAGGKHSKRIGKCGSASLRGEVQLQGSQDALQHFTAHGPELLRPQLHGLPECAWHDPLSPKSPAQTLRAASGCA